MTERAMTGKAKALGVIMALAFGLRWVSGQDASGTPGLADVIAGADGAIIALLFGLALYLPIRFVWGWLRPVRSGHDG